MKHWLAIWFVTIGWVIPALGQGKSLAPMKLTQIEEVSFEKAEFGAVLDYIAEKSSEAVGAPVNLVTLGEGTRAIPVTVQLRSVPLTSLLKYACEAADCEFVVQSDQTILVGSAGDIARTQAQWKSAPVVTGPGTASETMARETVVSLELAEADLGSAVDYLRAQTTNFVVLPGTDSDLAATPVTLKLANVSYSTAVRYLVAVAGPEVGFRVDRFAVVFGAPTDTLKRPIPAVELSNPVMVHMMRKRLPEVVIDGATLTEALELVRFHGADFSGGINILDQTGGVEIPVTLKAKNLPLSEALRYVCEQTGTTFTIEGRTLKISKLPPKVKE